MAAHENRRGLMASWKEAMQHRADVHFSRKSMFHLPLTRRFEEHKAGLHWQMRDQGSKSRGLSNATNTGGARLFCRVGGDFKPSATGWSFSHSSWLVQEETTDERPINELPAGGGAFMHGDGRVLAIGSSQLMCPSLAFSK